MATLERQVDKNSAIVLHCCMNKYNRESVIGQFSGVLPALTSHKSQVTSHKSQVTSHKSQVTSHKSQVTSHKSQVTSHKSQLSLLLPSYFVNRYLFVFRFSPYLLSYIGKAKSPEIPLHNNATELEAMFQVRDVSLQTKTDEDAKTKGHVIADNAPYNRSIARGSY